MPVSWDWLSAQQRLGQGRVSNPSQDAIGPANVPDWYWEQQRARQAQTPGLIPQPQDVEALPFGSLGDPVSQLAFLAAPGLLRGAKGALDVAITPGPSSLMRGGMLGSQRGNLGPPPMSATGEALPESMVRDEAGQLQRLYHGTDKVFPDFATDKAQGGLYGSGIYMTTDPEVAGGTGLTSPGFQQPALGYASPQGDSLIEKPLQSFTTRKEAETFGLAQNQREALFPTSVNEENGRWVVSRFEQGPTHPNVRPLYADLRRPFDIDGIIPTEQAKALLVDAGHPIASNLKDLKKWVTDQPEKTLSGLKVYSALRGHMGDEAANKFLEQHGYDGITHIGGGSRTSDRVYIAFSPDTVYPSVNVDALRGLSTQYPPR